MKLSITTFFIACVAILQAQEKQVDAGIASPSTLNVINLGDAGFVLSTGSEIAYFKSEADQVWKINASIESASSFFSGMTLATPSNRTAYDERETFMIASNNGNVVYKVEIKENQYSKKSHEITQINKEGAVKKFTIEGREELGKNLQTAFCDNLYFYYLATDKGNEFHDKKKKEERLIVNRFDAKDFSYKRMLLDLPPIEDGDISAFWTFLGQTDTEKFLVLKKIDYKEPKTLFTIVAFNAEGKVTRTFTIDHTMDGIFVRPAHLIKSPMRNFFQSAEFDFYMSKPQGSSYYSVIPTYGGYSDVYFDIATESFYVYGLSGSKPFKKVGPIYNGFYVYKYDKQGANQWKLQQPASADLMDENYFRLHALPGDRHISLKVFPSVINFSIHFKKIIFTHAITPDGKMVRQLKKEDHPFVADNLILSTTKLRSEDYISKINPKDKDKYLLVDLINSQGQILLELAPKGQLKVLYFKK